MLIRRLFAEAIGDEVALTEEARRQLEKLQDESPSSQTINALASKKDANLASAVLYQALLREPHHGAFIRAVDQCPTSAVTVDDAPLMIVVPGMFYREYLEIGADGKLVKDIARKFGMKTVTAPTSSLGSVNENLAILHEYLCRVATRPFWLVSMSRGSAEVKWLLQRYPDAPYLSALRVWLSIAGIVAGTPLHERIYANKFYGAMHRSLARINRISPALGEELVCSNPNWQKLTCPPHTQIINIIAVPLSWHVTESAIRRYYRLCPFGPTDGVVLLTDYLDEPGLIYPVWGADHFLRMSRIAALFYRLLYFLLVGEGEHDEKSDNRNSCLGVPDSERNGPGPACG